MNRALPLAFAASLVACGEGIPTAPPQSAEHPASGVASGSSIKSAAPTATYHFYNCTGPGAPAAEFDAEKTRLPAASGKPVASATAFRLLDGSGVFVVLSFGDPAEGFFSPPGIEQSGIVTVACKVGTRLTYTFSGFFVPTP